MDGNNPASIKDVIFFPFFVSPEVRTVVIVIHNAFISILSYICVLHFSC